MNKTIDSKILLVLSLIVFFLFLRWNSFTTPFERDEGEYAYGAWVMTQGGFPYKDTFLQKPPLIIYTYLLGEVITPGAIWFPRLLACIFGIGTSLILGLTAKKILGSGIFWPVVFLYPLVAFSPINSGLAANCEIFMLLPLSGLLYLSFLGVHKPKNWFISGTLASLSILYKPICLYIVVGVFLVSMIQIIKTKTKAQISLKLALFYLLGFLLTSGIVLTPVLLRGAFSAMWEQVAIFNTFYARHWGLSLKPLWNNLKVMAKSFWLVYLILFAGLFTKKVNKLLYLYLFLGLIAVFQTTIRHYYLLLIPFIVLITVSVIKQVRHRKWLLAVYSLLFISILYPICQQFVVSPADLSLWIYGRENPFYESMVVAGKLKGITGEKDCVFIAGSEPQILYYSQRESCSRFNITYPLIVDTPRRLNYQKQAIKEIEASLPSAIVFSNRVHSGLWNGQSPRDFINFLNDLLLRKYKLAGGFIWDQRGGYWLDKVDAEDLVNASLLLYKKI